MKRLPLLLAAIGLFSANIGLCDNGTLQAPAHPKMTVTNEKLDPRLLLKERDLLNASFSNADPDIPFPSRAKLNKVFKGSAAVGVMVDAEGKATDFLIVNYSQPYFADALLNALKAEEYSSRRVHGDQVAGRFLVKQTFSLANEDQIDPTRPQSVSISPMESLEANTNRITDGQKGPRLTYKAYNEHEIDGKTLKATAVVAPALPAEIVLDPKQPLKVIVSFYVDEKGNVRIPNVESDLAAPGVKSVIDALSGWKFAPPTFKGKPVLVFADRTLVFEIAPDGKTPDEKQAK